MGIIKMKFLALIAIAFALRLTDEKSEEPKKEEKVVEKDPETGKEKKVTILPPMSPDGKPHCNACKAVGSKCIKAYTSSTTVDVVVKGEEPTWIMDCYGVGDHTEMACAAKGTQMCT